MEVPGIGVGGTDFIPIVVMIDLVAFLKKFA